MNVVYYSVDPSALHASLPASIDSQFHVQTKIIFPTDVRKLSRIS